MSANDRPKVLIVDDEKINLDVIVGLLKEDYHPVAAKSGAQALQRGVHVRGGAGGGG